MIAISHARLRLALLLATGLAASVASTEGIAYTMEQQQACMPDAFRLCSSEIPDIERVRGCMIRNKSQLSPQCRAYFRPAAEPGEVADDASGRPLSSKPVAAHRSRHRIRPERYAGSSEER